MANLLPKEMQKKVAAHYRSRFLLVGSLMFLAIAFCTALALLPSYLAVRGRAESAAISSAGSSGNADSRTERVAILRAQGLLARISPLLTSTSSPTGAITAALVARPASIAIDYIAYSGGNSSSIIIRGTGARRDSVNGYRDALLKNTLFKSVVVPVGALVGVEAGKFTMTLTGNY